MNFLKSAIFLGIAWASQGIAHASPERDIVCTISSSPDALVKTKKTVRYSKDDTGNFPTRIGVFEKDTQGFDLKFVRFKDKDTYLDYVGPIIVPFTTGPGIGLELDAGSRNATEDASTYGFPVIAMALNSGVKSKESAKSIFQVTKSGTSTEPFTIDCKMLKKEESIGGKSTVTEGIAVNTSSVVGSKIINANSASVDDSSAAPTKPATRSALKVVKIFGEKIQQPK